MNKSGMEAKEDPGCENEIPGFVEYAHFPRGQGWTEGVIPFADGEKDLSTELRLPKLEFPPLFSCDVDLGDMDEAGGCQQTFFFSCLPLCRYIC
jgi:hypothetical protein